MTRKKCFGPFMGTEAELMPKSSPKMAGPGSQFHVVRSAEV